MTDGTWTDIILCTSAFAAGVMNSVAGGGTLLTFPALMAVVAPASANATSTVALLPGSFAGAWGYRKELAPARNFAIRMIPPSLVGGAIGALLLVSFPRRFGELVPWLILTAATLFLIQQPISQYLRKRQEKLGILPTDEVKFNPGKTSFKMAILIGFQFLVAVYGGYFGAGIGILMLTSLGFMGLQNIHHANAVKTLLASLINSISILIFMSGDLINWTYAIEMAVSAVIGGYCGANVARRLPPTYVRWTVVLIGFGLAAYYVWKSQT